MPDQVPIGGIGNAIEDEGPGKAKQFFTDPKNLATMLVLAAALTQPKTGGRSGLAHGLRAGVGALGFRGGLEQELTAQQQEATEAESVIGARESTAGFQQSQLDLGREELDVERQGQAYDVQQGELGRQSAERIAGVQAGSNTELRMLEGATKAYSDAAISAASLGQPAPDFGEFMQQYLASASFFGVPGAPRVEYIPDPGVETVPTPEEVRAQKIAATEAARAERAAKRETLQFTKQVSRLRDIEKAVAGGYTGARAQLAGSARTSEAIAGLTDEGIVALIKQKSEEGEALASSGSAEEISDFLRDNTELITKEVKKQLERALRTSASDARFSALPRRKL